MLREHITWLSKRGLSEALATSYGLRSVETSGNGQRRAGIEIPYPTGRKTRWLSGDGSDWTFPGGGKEFWNQGALFDPLLAEQPLIITEGEWDALSAISAGYLRTMSVPNGAHSSFDWLEPLLPRLRQCRRIILLGDNDEAGASMNAVLAKKLGASRCYRVEFVESIKDLNALLIAYGAEAVREAIDQALPCPISGLRTLSQYRDVPRPELFDTGWQYLNPHLRLWRGELAVVTGIPNHGKSRFALEMLCGLNLRHEHRACIASMEMAVVPYVRDILREHYHNQRYWDLSKDQQRHADQWVERAFYFIDHDAADDTEQASLEWYVEKAEDAVCRHNVEWLLIDPWNQIEHVRDRYETEQEYQARAIRTLKKFARHYNCGVILVVHPTKAVVEKQGKPRKPTLYDISGSAHWYNAADHGIVVWADSILSPVRTIDVQKVRHLTVGTPGQAYLELTKGRLESIRSPRTNGAGNGHAQFSFSGNY